MDDQEPIEEKAVSEKKLAKTGGVGVMLKKTHTHAGIVYLAGDCITVTVDEAEFLKKMQVV